MRLLLDEIWSSEIAVQLRRRGHDAIAATEPVHETRYRGIADHEFFDRAPQDRRAVVTDNVGDFESVRLEYDRAGRAHFGVVYALAPTFDRHRSASVAGRMVSALDALMKEIPDNSPRSLAVFLRGEP